jgi:hypothetical protein
MGGPWAVEMHCLEKGGRRGGKMLDEGSDAGFDEAEV